MKKPLVMIAGNLGAGKTTLAMRIHEHFGWWIGRESVADNPYLTDFYSDMRTWSFHLQIFFLGNRANLHRTASSKMEGAILDRSIYEDRHIFAKALHGQGLIAERDLISYDVLYQGIVSTLEKPNLIIYLTAPVEVLTQRIRKRAQPFDRDISPGYLTMIDEMYREWAPQAPADNMLQIDSTSANFELDNSDTPQMESVFKSIENAL